MNIKSFKHICAGGMASILCSYAAAWDGTEGPSKGELVKVENPSGVLAGNIIESGAYAGDVGVLASGAMGDTVYLADDSFAGKNIWFATDGLTGGSAYRIYGGGNFTGSASSAVIGDTHLQIGGDSTTLALDRIYGGSNVTNGASVEQGSIDVDIYGNVATGGIIAAAGQAWSGDGASSLGSIHVRGDVNLSMHGGTVDSPTEDFGDGVHTISSGIYGGARVGSQNKSQGSFAADGSVNVYLGGSLKINANVFTGGEALNEGASILVKGGTNLVIDGATLTASEALVGGARATFITGTNPGSGSVAEIQNGSKVVMSAGTVGESSNPHALTGIIGGGWASGAGKSVVDYSSVKMSGGDAYTDVYGGSYAQQNGKSVNGTEGDSSASKTVSSVEISGSANVAGDVFAGSRHDNAMNGYDASSNIWGNTSAVISGGSAQDVYGGSITVNDQSYGNSVANVYGNANVEIKGGSMRNVYGGSYAQANVAGGKVEAAVSGDTNITVGGGKISGDIYGGGYGESSVKGNANVTFAGSGSAIDFAGTVYGGGANGADVEGAKTFSFGNSDKAFTGNFNGKISGFDKVVFSSGSNVAVKGGVYNSNIVIDGGQMVSIDNAVYENTYDDKGINEGWRPNSKIEVSNASALNLNKAVFKGNTLVGTAVPTSGTGVWGMVQGRDSAVDISNSSFVGNRAITIPADPTATYGVANSQGGAVYFNGGSGVIRSTVFENNSALSANSQGGALAIFSGDYRFDSVKFSGNYSGLNEGSVSKSLMSGGALYIGETGGNAAKISISNSSFAGNAAEGAQVRGGAIVYSAENADSYLKIDNSSFTGNRADGVTMARGGAVRLYGGNAPSKVENNVFTDVGFTENVASASNATSATVGGGAVFLDGAVLTFKATKDMTYSGNAAVINGVNDDRYGGFLMMNKNVDTNPPAENYAKAIFYTDRGATLTIGTAGRTGYDSIASVDGTSIVEKRGEGKLIVNSSMEHFKGSLIVGGGEMTANNRLGASSISIASGAALGVKVFGNAALSSSSLAFDNSGTFKLVAAEGLAAGSYGVSADSGFASGDKYINGTVKTFGGTFDAAANSFIVAEAKKITIDDPIQPKTSVEENGRVEISTSSVADAPAVVMNFSSNNEYAINSVTDVAADEKFVEAVSSLEEGALMAGAYDFNLETELAEGDSVSLSFYIGAGSFDLGSFKLFHQNDDGTWTLMENVEGVTYDGNYLSFEVAHFSSYGFALVPEPAAFAALAGLVILVFSARRRRV